jgi:1-pyrroline-5-carboxylate dehydrogenase
MDGITRVPRPVNEPVRDYAPGSGEVASLERRLKELAGQQTDLTATIGGEQRAAGGAEVPVVAPHARPAPTRPRRSARPPTPGRPGGR